MIPHVELALLNNAPRAATIVAAAPPGVSLGRVRVAVLAEQAFKRLVGSLASTMELHASQHYFNGGAGTGTASGVVGPGPSEAESEGIDPRAGAGAGLDGGLAGAGSGRWVGGLGASPFATPAS